MPGRTKVNARSAAARFCSSTSIGTAKKPSRPPAICAETSAVAGSSLAKTAICDACTPPQSRLGGRHVTIVFDLDGTLIDTAPDLIDTLNLVLTQEGLPAVPYATARNLIGGGAQVMIERALAAEGRDATDAEMDRLYKAFIAHYSEHIADRSRPFPGLDSALNDLRAAGHGLRSAPTSSNGCRCGCSNAQADASVCRHLRTGYVWRHEARPGSLSANRAARRRRAQPGHHGRRFQNRHSHRPGGKVPVIAVDFGYTEVPIASLQPDRIISSFAELPAAIGDLLALQP